MKSRLPILFVFLICFAFAESENPFEPSVSMEESKVLTHAMDLAVTNHLAAIRLIREQLGSAETVSPAVDFAVGNLYFQHDELSLAREAYQTAIAKRPQFRNALINLGRIHLLEERAADAITLYQQLVKDGQSDADTSMLLGHALMMENHPVSAESAYRHCLLLAPRRKEAMTGLAKSLLQQERYAEGLALIREIMEQDPANAELWTLRANAFLTAGDFQRALQAIESADRLNCVDESLRSTLGDLYLNRDQPEDALAAYERAFASGSPSPERVLRAMQGFLLIGDRTGAAKMVERLRDSKDLKPAETLRFLRLQAELAHLEKDRDLAKELTQRVLELDPLDGDALMTMAMLLQEDGELEQAVLNCERAARITGFEAEALVRQAQIEVERNRYPEAVRLLESAQAFQNQAHVARYLAQLRRIVN